jgi:hypothetical protein
MAEVVSGDKRACRIKGHSVLLRFASERTGSPPEADGMPLNFLQEEG